MLFDGIWYTPESQLCHTPKEKRPETPRESGRYIWWSWRELNPRPKFIISLIINNLLKSDFTAALLRRFFCPGGVV
ncbi:hypothetical protein CO696_11865 [Salmonella enterica subsp. enterica serovar Saintpaul]|nr:hypothetical protein CO696_11865 [Salmonella enterica subsp. enterica serovar Saintpaul]